MTARIFAAILTLCLSLPWGGAMARDLKIIFYQFTPPYVFERGDGITVEIVKSSLEPFGYQVVPVFVPMGRGFELFAERRLDGVTIVRDGAGLDGFYSDVFVQYHNQAFALKSRGLKLNTIRDLAGLSVLAFQNANKFLDPEFTQAMAGNPGYREVADQEMQVLMLLMGRADVAVMDESIFRFYREKLIAEGKVPRALEYQAFPLFAPTPYKTAFTDSKVRDDFNRGLAALRASGEYEAIYRKYIDRYFEVKR